MTKREFITRQNILDLIHSAGLEMKAKASPSYWSHEDRERAKRHEPILKACRRAWTEVNKGEEIFSSLKRLIRDLGSESNCLRLALEGTTGKFERSEEQIREPMKTNAWGEDAKGDGFFWLTFEGDLFGVNRGDKLNLPSVHRVANANLPKEKQKTAGAAKIASLLPNPCTRIKGEVQIR